MKANICKKLFSVVSTCVLLVACFGQPDHSSTPPEPEANSKATVPGSKSQDSAVVPPKSFQLPDVMLGTFDTTQADCSSPGTSITKVAIYPDKLNFFGGHATVSSVNPQGSGYSIDTSYYQTEGIPDIEIVPTPAEFRIELTEEGIRLEGFFGSKPMILVRCG